MLKNAYSLAKIGADTAENERNFAEILPKFGSSELRRGRLGGGELLLERRGPCEAVG